MSSSRYSRSSSSKRTKSTAPTSASSRSRRSSAYDNAFEQHLIDNKVYLNNRKSKPGKSTGLYQILSNPRPSLSPSRFSDNAFEDFQQKHEDVTDEGEVMRDLVPIICGASDILNKQNLQFSRLEPIAGGATVDGKPDFYDGAHIEEIDKQVQEDLGPFIIPTGHRTAPVAPNFFLEAKAPKGAADVAKRQACYDGALGARAMHKLQSYGEDEPVYDGNAYTMSTTYHAGTGTLQMYTTHPTQAADGSTEYHMAQVDGWNLTGNANTFRQGATAFRNARGWAQQQRDSFIAAANERARLKNTEPSHETSDHDGIDDTTDTQDTLHAPDSSYTQEARYIQNTVAEDPVDDQLYTSQQDFQGYTSTFQSFNYDGLIESQPSTFNSPNYSSNMDQNQESETSADELALDTYTTTTTSNKRTKSSAKIASKATRYEDQSSYGRHRSKR